MIPVSAQRTRSRSARIRRDKMRKSRAIIIGSSQYGDKAKTGLESHTTIARSAEQWEAFLKEDPLWESTNEDEGLENKVHRLDGSELQSINGVMSAVEAAADEANDMLLVVYIGHGKCWETVPGKQVHLAVESSRGSAPYTWLSSWYLYRAMRNSRASSKILIADCCYSNELSHLDDGSVEDEVVGEAFNTSRPEGTLVVKAVQKISRADSEGCPRIKAPELQECTTLSGHLLNVLRRCVTSGGDLLTSHMIVNKLRSEMLDCATNHPEPGGTLNGALSDIELFTNRLRPQDRQQRSDPSLAEEWVNALLNGELHSLDRLLKNVRKTHDVVTKLAQRPGLGPEIARDVHKQAMRQLPPDKLADYFRARQEPAA